MKTLLERINNMDNDQVKDTCLNTINHMTPEEKGHLTTRLLYIVEYLNLEYNLHNYTLDELLKMFM